MNDSRLEIDSSVFFSSSFFFFAAASFDLISTVLPETLARELCLTGRLMNAEEALNSGFANEISKPEELLNRAKELAQGISESKNTVNMKAEFRKLQPNLFKN